MDIHASHPSAKNADRMGHPLPCLYRRDQNQFASKKCGADKMHRSFVGRPSRCEGLDFLRMTKFFGGSDSRGGCRYVGGFTDRHLLAEDGCVR
jgi:hypothetical protein